MTEKNRDQLEIIAAALGRAGLDREPAVVTEFSGDGSLRRFFRLGMADGSSYIAILPADHGEPGMAEALAAWHICRHLFAAGVPVAEPHGFDAQSGLVWCEDLGTTRLHDLCGAGRAPLNLYAQAVRELARMQVRGARDFDPSWCWEGRRYDRTLMLERESGYFAAALCKDYLGLEFDENALHGEFSLLAERAGAAPADYFLHRDFQSRNIMIKNDRVRFVDFQGGRLGPLAYDLASLLIDPYVGLDRETRRELRAEYLDELRGLEPYDPGQFMREYASLALQRNLQILGAFAFLTKQRGKVFFRAHIEPALISLQGLLAEPEAADYPVLRKLTEICLSKVNDEI